MSFKLAADEEGIKEVKKKGVEALLFVNAPLFVRCTTV
jgi:hypothetical protein